MKNRQLIVWSLFAIVFVAGAGLAFLALRDRAQAPASSQPTRVFEVLPTQGSSKVAVVQPSVGSPVEPTIQAVQVGLAEQPGSFPAVEWSQPPDCQNQPEGTENMARTLLRAGAEKQSETDLQRARLLSPKLAAFSQSQASHLLANDDASEQRQQTMLGLAVNIATGRINRETQVDFMTLPDVKTIGELLTELENAPEGQALPPALLEAAQQVLNGRGITRPVCAHLLVTQNGSRPADIQWSSTGMQASTPAAMPSLQSQAPGPVIDTVTVSPDGRWGALTSIGNDSGGPLMVQNIQSGEWSNLIEKMNASLPAGQAPLPANGWWDLIGWLPDSQRLVLGPSDASAVYVVDIHSGQFEMLPFEGGGNGGAMFVGLAPDGSQLAYVALASTGDGQVLVAYNLASGQTKALLQLGYDKGMLFYPRFAPDGQSLAYIIQKGTPKTGYSYAIQSYHMQSGTVSVLADGNLGLSVPTWSPDGQYLAFTRKDRDEPDRFNPDRPLEQPQSNLWVANMATGEVSQMTFITGQARHPVWGSDARTLSFITHAGEVGLVNITQPGQIWRAAQSDGQTPLLTSAFFVP